MSLCGDYLNITRSNVQLTGMWFVPPKASKKGGVTLDHVESEPNSECCEMAAQGKFGLRTFP